MLKHIALAGGIFLASTTGALACEDGHWINSVSADGEVIILDDGSVWLIDAVDQVNTALWLPTTEVVACPGTLINTEDAEKASARRVR